MTVLDEFYASYLHYTVAFRLWTDTCRQLSLCRGTLEERQALVDETLRLSMCVADNIDDTESPIADTLEYLQSSEGGDPDLLDAISLITNNLKEDRTRADDYTKFVMRRRSGGKEKRPRRPQIANPFVFVPDEETVPEEEGPVTVDSDPGEEPIEEEPVTGTEDPASEMMEEYPTEGPSPEEGDPEGGQPPETESDNPLAEESERIAENATANIAAMIIPLFFPNLSEHWAVCKFPAVSPLPYC